MFLTFVESSSSVIILFLFYILCQQSDRGSVYFPPLSKSPSLPLSHLSFYKYDGASIHSSTHPSLQASQGSFQKDSKTSYRKHAFTTQKEWIKKHKGKMIKGSPRLSLSAEIFTRSLIKLVKRQIPDVALNFLVVTANRRGQPIPRIMGQRNRFFKRHLIFISLCPAPPGPNKLPFFHLNSFYLELTFYFQRWKKREPFVL